ncbi:TPA: hypothetical protein QCH98_004073 [Enterobacter bugandensis]|uniref:hypothetical protein n=1 Tax=Enterobacter hormaechei TaxID=158836 RepID=UPI0029751622|nr:hypothetical protein [Enterobacter cloacae]HCM9645863.1 hypothetical protein [Enterobacter hormaechei subsp. xiangfangensis]HDR2398770.1 hypothetical protein [Enterobacter bugandensis]HAS1149846.1 hypothetical protein [Enterobacter cloacae]HAV2196478.1 hypothetical protein [Enterobacter cloacae]
MSVKTEAIKPAAEISLFDVFGPNVSEQVQAINQRAAELSMDDMALVMGVKKSVKQKPAALDDGADSYDALGAWLSSKENRASATFQIEPAYVKGFMVTPPEFVKGVPVVAESLIRPYFPVLRHSQQGIQAVMTAMSSKLHHLQGVGVDESKISVSIRYKDPKTGAFRSESLDAESGISHGFFGPVKLRPKKYRRIGRGLITQMLPVKK